MQVDLSSGIWRGVSIEAKGCIRRMLQLEPAQRPRAADLLHEQWLCHSASSPLPAVEHLEDDAPPPAADLRRAVDLTFQVLCTKVSKDRTHYYPTLRVNLYKLGTYLYLCGYVYYVQAAEKLPSVVAVKHDRATYMSTPND